MRSGYAVLVGVVRQKGRQRRDLNRSQTVVLTSFGRCDWQGSNPSVGVSRLTESRAGLAVARHCSANSSSQKTPEAGNKPKV